MNRPLTLLPALHPPRRRRHYHHLPELPQIDIPTETTTLHKELATWRLHIWACRRALKEIRWEIEEGWTAMRQGPVTTMDKNRAATAAMAARWVKFLDAIGREIDRLFTQARQFDRRLSRIEGAVAAHAFISEQEMIELHGLLDPQELALLARQAKLDLSALTGGTR